MNVRSHPKQCRRCLLEHRFSLLEQICCQVKSVREIRDEETTFAVYLSILSDQELVSWQSGNSSSFSTAYFICCCHSILMKLRNLRQGNGFRSSAGKHEIFGGVSMEKFSPQVFHMSCQRFGNESLINLRCFGEKSFWSLLRSLGTGALRLSYFVQRFMLEVKSFRLFTNHFRTCYQSSFKVFFSSGNQSWL